VSDYAHRPLVYVAGPYTLPDPVENAHHAIRFASELLDEGLVTPFVPHLTLLWHLVAPRDVDFWYDYDIAMLAKCDAIFRLPGESVGADREVNYARDEGLPVFEDIGELRGWAKRWVRAHTHA